MNIEKFLVGLDDRTTQLDDQLLTTRVEINQHTYKLIQSIKGAVEDSTL